MGPPSGVLPSKWSFAYDRISGNLMGPPSGVLLTVGLVETWEGFPMKFCLQLD